MHKFVGDHGRGAGRGTTFERVGERAGQGWSVGSRGLAHRMHILGAMFVVTRSCRGGDV